jgi:uncharacterized protein (TIGR00645 family)
MQRVERVIEAIIFSSRWLMVPFFLGLILSLLVLMFRFMRGTIEFFVHMQSLSETDVIIGVLDLVDLTLTTSLVLIVIFSGYENFVSKIDVDGHPDWPEWMTKVDFAGLKQKLLASIVAISAIQVLKAFMNLEQYPDTTKLAWLVGIHVVFVFSVLVLAISDRLGEKAKADAG